MKHRIIRTFGMILAAAIVLATPGTAQTACNVVYTISPQNSSAFGAAITIQNTGTTAFSSWSLTWTFANGQTVSSLWNGIESQSGANVTVANEPYNGSIPAGGTLSGIGFNGTWNGSANAVPASFAINGTTCGATGGFKLAPSAPALTVALGASGTDTITVTDISPFTGSVSFTATGQPNGVTASFSPTSSTSSSVLTLAVAATTVAGTYPITITGTSGTVTETTSVSLTVTGGGFTLSASPATLSVAQGASATDTITVKDVSPFSGIVAFTASGMPAGVTASFSPASSATSSVLTLTAANSSSCSASTGTITITGTSGALTEATSIVLTVPAAPSCFTLSASPSALSIAQGTSGTDTVTVAESGAGSVTLAATGMPTGVTVAFSANPTATSSVLTFAVSASTVPGIYPITITGTSGTQTATAAISLTVTSTNPSTCAVNYVISPQSSSAFGAALTIQNTGSSAWTSWTLTWAFANGQTVSSLWNGIETQSGANVTVKNESYNGAVAAGGSLTGIGFNGTWNGVTNAVPTAFSINGAACAVAQPPGFKLAPSAGTLSVTQGSNATDTISVTDVSGFTGSVTFAATGLPSGVTASFSPASSTSSSVLTLTAANSATLGGPVTVTINGTSGTTTASTTIALTVKSAAGFTLAPSAPNVPLAVSSTATDTITITDTGGFTGSVTLAATGLPTGVTAAFTPNPATTTSVLTLTSSAAVAAGVSTVTITGTSGTITSSTTITVTISGPPGYTLAASPAALTVAPGSSGSSTITVTDENGFTGSVTLATSALPTGVTVAIGTNPATATSLLTFTVAATAADGTSTITITGTSGTLAPVATTVTLTVGTGLASTFKQHFLDMWSDMNPATNTNGYFSPLGIPYHSVETMIIEAPDYGHETVSETYSYYLWLESLYGAVTGTWTPLQTAWDSYQTYMIPSAAEQPTNAGYNPSSPATYAPTGDSPSDYPSTLTSSVTVGIDPLASELNTTYGTPNIYGAHWIIDSSDWYGYGINENGTGTPSCINTYQRGPQESVWLTVPQPCWDNFVYGNTTDGGYLSLFTSGPYTQQWKYTDAPDADARAIQAMYWAQQYANGNTTVSALLPNAAELGDYLRYSFFDKYFKEQGCQSLSCPVENGTKNSSAYLLAWYYAWGGAIPADGSWAWRIGSSDVHFGYQNPLAAYALSTDTALIPKSPTAKADWTTTLSRMIQFYRWLQSSQGAIAGGATNSWGGGSNNAETAWGGQYATPPAGTSTFYGMSYIAEPSYDNPPSNQWFGFQAWSMERVAEYYYVTGNADAKIVLDPWIAWVEANTTATSTGYSIPSSMTWTGQPSLNWNATTQDWTPGDLGVTYNTGLSVTITASGQDVGVTGSLCKALLYYSAGTAKWAGAQDMPSFTLAQTLLQDIWALDRDSIGVSAPETGTTYNQITTPIFIPSGWTGTMPNGDPINSDSTFLSIRTQYEKDPEYPVVAAYAAGTGPAPVFKFHRFWAQTDAATAYAVYYLLFPND